jgi:hypothetical protein
MKRVFVLGFLCASSALFAMDQSAILGAEAQKARNAGNWQQLNMLNFTRHLEYARTVKAKQRNLEALKRADYSPAEAVERSK